MLALNTAAECLIEKNITGREMLLYVDSQQPPWFLKVLTINRSWQKQVKYLDKKITKVMQSVETVLKSNKRRALCGQQAAVNEKERLRSLRITGYDVIVSINQIFIELSTGYFDSLVCRPSSSTRIEYLNFQKGWIQRVRLS